MTATITLKARESQIDEGPMKYYIELLDKNGFVRHTSKGPTRELAIQGLKDYGFIVSDQAAPNAEYREYLKSIEPKLV